MHQPVKAPKVPKKFGIKISVNQMCFRVFSTVNPKPFDSKHLPVSGKFGWFSLAVEKVTAALAKESK